MRHSTLGFLFTCLCTLLYTLYYFSTLISLLFEDGSADIIQPGDLMPTSASIDDPVYMGSQPSLALIPRILHQTYINETIPHGWVSAQQSCISLHQPDWEYRLWTDASSIDFIAEHYPWFSDTFASYPYNIQRADAIRYFVLRKYGGVYLDLDDGCARRLDPLLKYSAFARLTTPTGISNDVLGATPEHPFFVSATESLGPANRNWVFPYVTIMASTGPLFLSLVWKKWMAAEASEAIGGEGSSRRVRLLTPDAYSEQTGSFFKLYKGNSWHRGDAKMVFWLAEHWVLATATTTLVVLLGGLATWKLYSMMLGRSHQEEAEREGGVAWWRKVWRRRGDGRRGMYEALLQKEGP